MLFLKNIRKTPVKIKVLDVSGTIKKLEMRAEILLTKWINKCLKNNSIQDKIKNEMLIEVEKTKKEIKNVEN